MVKVSVEVRSEAARFRVAVRAENIGRALSLVEERYPAGDVRVEFPIDPEAFFADDPATRAGIAGFEQPDEIAA